VRRQTITFEEYRLNNKKVFSFSFRKGYSVFVVSYVHPPQQLLVSYLPGKERWYTSLLDYVCQNSAFDHTYLVKMAREY
jgi:hypothetical protein